MKLIQKSFSVLGLRTALAAILACLAVATSQASDERGKQLYINCNACHGKDGLGNPLLKAPAVAGLSEKYVAAQLTKFKEGHRGSHPDDVTGLMMMPNTLTLNGEEDINAVAAYIASLDAAPRPATMQGDVEKGKALYQTCQACHGADGSGNDLLNAPSLINQHDWYLVAQLHKFRAGIRGGNPQDVTGSQMRPMAMVLADEQAMLDVVAYIQSLSK